MRTREVRKRRRVRWGNLFAGFVAFVTLGALALSPFLATKAISIVHAHEGAVIPVRANRVNQDVRDADLDFVVHSARCGATTLVAEDGTDIRPRNGEFCVIDVTVHNNGTAPEALSQREQLATGSRGAVYLSEATVDTAVSGGNPAVVPGGSWEAQLVYDVPTGIELVRIDLHGSEYSRGVSVRL
jgi:hypothetical protein